MAATAGRVRFWRLDSRRAAAPRTVAPTLARMSDQMPRDVVGAVLAPYDCGVAPSANDVVALAAELMGPGFPGGAVIRGALSELVEAGEVAWRWDPNPGTGVYCIGHR